MEKITDRRGRSRNKLTYSCGYAKAYRPNHPRAINGRVFEHIIVWEEANGKQLPSDWIIHHINGKKADNRPENLLAMPRKSHHKDLILQGLRNRVKKLETELNLLKAQQKMI